MNIENTKYKSNSNYSELINRLSRLEKLLQGVLEISADLSQNSANSLITGKVNGISSSNSNNPISELITASMRKNDKINQSATSIRPSGNSSNVNSADLTLSHGQIIAEIAMAISRFTSRNS